MNELTVNDINTLQDALDAFESASIKDHVMGDMMNTMLSAITVNREDPEQVRIFEERETKREIKYQEILSKQRSIKEQVILLKAKLIRMKDTCGVSDLISSTVEWR
jgi:hypothetical protein